MPTGSFDYSPPSGDLAEFATAILVCRYDSKATAGQRYTYLPNVFCDAVQEKEGDEPPTARFRYIADDDGSWPYPSAPGLLWPINAPPSPYRVRCGDELVVLWIDPAGNYLVLWHGFAQLPQLDIGPRARDTTFIGVHVSARLWDQVVRGRWQRDGSQPSTPGKPLETNLPTHFNPDELPNCTPDSTDEQDSTSGAKWPVFLEPKLQQVGGKTVQTQWTLSKMVRYLLWYYNDEIHVQNPDFSVLDDLLSCRSPKQGSSFYDPSNPSTYDETPIVIRDFDATNRPAFEVIRQQLAYAGFRLKFVTEGQPSQGYGDAVVEEPYNVIEIYRFDAAGPASPKWLSLADGATLDPATSNVATFSAQNDFNAVANQWTVETRPTHYEVGVVLAPGFQPAAGDESTSNRKKWLSSNQDTATKGDREKYRLYIADECGEGHWDMGQKKWLAATDAKPLDLTDLFFDQDTNPDGAYVPRYRPGLNTLFSLDPAGQKYRAQLRLSRDYAGAAPALWDGSGTWQVIDGGFRLLHDRLGIRVSIENPMEWDVGKPNPAAGTPQEPSGVLDGVTSLSNPGTAQRQKPFTLMLVTVIPGDQGIDATADSRLASPYPFTVARQVDAADHFQKQVIDVSSPFRPNTPGGTARDDTDAATTYAEQMRAAHEFPPIAAVATIPWFTTAYRVGDRIAAIDGQGIDLQSNAGVEQGEAPAYPYVVAVSWTFGGDGQSTVLQLSDRRNEPAPLRR